MSQALMLLAGFGVSALVGGGAAALAQDSRKRRIAARVGEFVTPLAAARASAPPAARLGVSGLLDGWRPRLAALCGYDIERQAAYPARIPLLLLFCALPAIIIDRLAGRVLGLPLAPVLPLLWIGCTQVLFRTLHARHADKLYRQLPDTLSMIVRSVRAGIPLHEALRGVARESMEPTARLFARICDQMAIGIRLDEALREGAARSGVAEYGFFAVALTLQAQTGGSLAETLDGLAEVIRKRVALRHRAAALASEARTSAYVLAALPVVTGSVLSVLNYGYIRPLFDTPGGNHVLFLAIFLLGLAGVVMRALIRRSLR